MKLLLEYSELPGAAIGEGLISHRAQSFANYMFPDVINWRLGARTQSVGIHPPVVLPVQSFEIRRRGETFGKFRKLLMRDVLCSGTADI